MYEIMYNMKQATICVRKEACTSTTLPLYKHTLTNETTRLLPRTRLYKNIFTLSVFKAHVNDINNFVLSFFTNLPTMSLRATSVRESTRLTKWKYPLSTKTRPNVKRNTRNHETSKRLWNHVENRKLRAQSGHLQRSKAFSAKLKTRLNAVIRVAENCSRIVQIQQSFSPRSISSFEGSLPDVARLIYKFCTLFGKRISTFIFFYFFFIFFFFCFLSPFKTPLPLSTHD